MVFTFGENWRAFSRVLDEDRIEEAEASLRQLLGTDDLDGMRMADVGAGSGLFSIAAVRLGARQVTAIDRDLNCVGVIRENAARFLDAADADRIQACAGDVLDPRTLPPDRFDIVYAWGSLHHTGAMWTAIEHAAGLCRPGGTFVLAIYNQTWFSGGWLRIKQAYHLSPGPVRQGMVAALAGMRGLARVATGRPFTRSERGMSVWYDAVDWLGGLPYECATPAAVERFLGSRGFVLVRRWITRRHGCNQFSFRRGMHDSGAMA